MHKLIKLQLRNVFHNKLFYICLALMLLLTPVLDFIGEIALNGIKIADEVLTVDKTMVFPEFAYFIKSEVGLVGSIFIALFCCLDFNEGTLKNIIARGYTKTQYLFSKYITTLIGLFTMYVITFIVTFILFVKNGIGYDSNTLLTIINSLFQIISITVMFSTFSIIFEKNGSAIIACLFAPNIFSLVLSLLDKYLHLDITKYWINNIPSIYLNNPTTGKFLLTVVYYGLYVLVFAFIGNYLFKNKEIK